MMKERQKKQSEDMRVALREFARGPSDKNYPPYFAGRRELVSSIEDAVETSWSMHESGRAQNRSSVRVIYGAPGAGKSSMLMHLESCWAEGSYLSAGADGGLRRGPVPLMLYMQSTQIVEPRNALRSLVQALSPDGEARLAVSRQESRRVEGGLSIGLGKAGASGERVEGYAVAEGLRGLAEAFPPERWSRPVVLGVDEAQNTCGGRDSPAGLFLRDLHANDPGLPLTVVLGGLSDTVGQLGELGLSRLSRSCIHSLGCLGGDEVEELKHGFCSHFGIGLKGREAELDRVLMIADRWPSHITHALGAFAEAYLEQGCDIGKVDFAEVGRESLRRRKWHYNDRVSDQMDDSAVLLSAVMERIDGSHKRFEVIEIIEREASAKRGRKRLAERLPEEMTAKEYFAHLIHRGALQVMDDDLVVCPIPSFRRYLIERGAGGETGLRSRGMPFGIADDAERVWRAH